MLQPLGKWWKAMEHSIAWRLLERAKNGDQYDRIKAIRQLVLIDHLKGNYNYLLFCLSFK